MRVVDYQILIKSLPVRKQCGTTKRSVWERFEVRRPWFREMNDNIFNGESNVTLSRQDVFSVNNNMRALIIQTIFWGYLKGMRGHNFRNILSEIDFLETVLIELRQRRNLTLNNFNNALNCFGQVPGLGISTFSKLLYFLEIKICNCPALILDKRLIGILNGNRFEEFVALQHISYNNATANYIEYLKISKSLARQLHTKSENIEQFTYIFGSSLKN